jgi:hypothetical protein
MALYDMQCIHCDVINEFLISWSEEPKPSSKNIVDLVELSLSCSKCGKTKFKKVITAHGKTAQNWANWQEGLGCSSKCSSKGGKSCQTKSIQKSLKK